MTGREELTKYLIYWVFGLCLVFLSFFLFVDMTRPTWLWDDPVMKPASMTECVEGDSL